MESMWLNIFHRWQGSFFDSREKLISFLNAHFWYFACFLTRRVNSIKINDNKSYSISFYFNFLWRQFSEIKKKNYSNSVLDILFYTHPIWWTSCTSVRQKLQISYQSSLLFSHCFYLIIMCRNLYQLNFNHCHGNTAWKVSKYGAIFLYSDWNFRKSAYSMRIQENTNQK